jgi:hypothetical protein
VREHSAIEWLPRDESRVSGLVGRCASQTAQVVEAIEVEFKPVALSQSPGKEAPETARSWHPYFSHESMVGSAPHPAVRSGLVPQMTGNLSSPRRSGNGM